MNEQLNLKTWQRALLAVLSGLLFGLSQPLVISPRELPIDPSGLSGLLIFVAFVPLLLAIRGGGPKRAYWLAWLSLVVAFSIIVYWITVAMTVFGKIPLVVAAIILLALTSALAFYVSTAFALTQLLHRRFKWPLWIVFPAALGAVELMRNYGPVSGFPWGSPGYSLATVPLFLQGASLVGVYGLVIFVALINIVLVEVVLFLLKKRELPKRPIIVAAVVLVVWAGWGALRLSQVPSGPTIKVALLQGNIDQAIKNQSKLNSGKIRSIYRRLQDQAIAQDVDVVVWPEAAVPRPINARVKDLHESDVLKQHSGPLPPGFVVGAVVYERYKDERGKNSSRHYNTAIIGDGARITGRFDKTHLVPFGEYVPWPLNNIIRQFVAVGGATPGGELKARPLMTKAGEIQSATTICYEGIFPEISRELAGDGAQVMFNVTNDAWYGVSSAAIQHLLMYAMRSAETGRAVARVANTGISAWVDTRGRVHDKTGMYVETVLIADVPLSDETTPYVAIGDVLPIAAALWIFGSWIYILLGAGFLRRERHVIEWVVGVLGLAIFVFLFARFHIVDGLNRDEAALNQVAFGGVSALLAGIGALSGKRWGRRAQMIVGGVFFLMCVAAGIALKSVFGVGFGLLALGVCVVAFFRKSQYEYPDG